MCAWFATHNRPIANVRIQEPENAMVVFVFEEQIAAAIEAHKASKELTADCADSTHRITYALLRARTHGNTAIRPALQALEARQG
jgi:hypothetical protein